MNLYDVLFKKYKKKPFPVVLAKRTVIFFLVISMEALALYVRGAILGWTNETLWLLLSVGSVTGYCLALASVLGVLLDLAMFMQHEPRGGIIFYIIAAIIGIINTGAAQFVLSILGGT
jgi:hypothetical protein